MSVVIGLLSWGIILNVARGWEVDKPIIMKYFYVPSSDLKSVDGEVEMNGASGIAMIPVSLSESVFLLPGVLCKGLFLDYQVPDFSYPTPMGMFTEKDLPRSLYIIDLIMGINVDWDKKWGSTLIVYPGIHSDMDDIGGSDIYFSGAVTGSYRFSSDFILIAGIYYDDSFGYPQLLPLLGSQWQMSEYLAIDALLPQYLVFSCRLDPHLAFGLKANVAGDQYRLSKFQPWKDTVINFTQVMSGPFIDLTLIDNLVLRCEGGYVFNRQFEFRDDDTDDKLWDGDLEDNWYGALTLALQY